MSNPSIPDSQPTTEPDESFGELLSRDVAFQVPDRLFVTGDDPFHQIADRHYADGGAVLDYRKVPEMAIGHDGHALVDGVLAGHKDHRTGHDLLHPSVLRRPSLKDDLAGIVTLGEDPHEFAFKQHQ